MSNTYFHGLDDLREWLEAQGFRTAVYSLGGRDNQCNWYAYKLSTLPARECECNDGKPMQLVVRPFKCAFSPPRAWESVEVDVSGEAGGVWFKLMAYSLTPSELRSKLPEVEARLIAAWNSLLPNVRGKRRRQASA